MAKPDDWSLARGERDGYPMILRIANAYLGCDGVPGYLHSIIVGTRLRQPTHLGLPSQSEADDLESFELNLCKALEAQSESLCVLVITNRGFRDFIFYTRDPQHARQKLLMATPELTSHQFQVAVQPDAGWELYRAVTRGMSAPSSSENVC